MPVGVIPFPNAPWSRHGPKKARRRNPTSLLEALPIDLLPRQRAAPRAAGLPTPHRSPHTAAAPHPSARHKQTRHQQKPSQHHAARHLRQARHAALKAHGQEAPGHEDAGQTEEGLAGQVRLAAGRAVFSEVRPRPVRRIVGPGGRGDVPHGFEDYETRGLAGRCTSISGCNGRRWVRDVISRGASGLRGQPARLAGQEQDEAADDQEDDGLLSSSVRGAARAAVPRAAGVYSTRSRRWRDVDAGLTQAARTRTSTPKP